jgi:eukaryotic-like serine/threonine-protein kinase
MVGTADRFDEWVDRYGLPRAAKEELARLIREITTDSESRVALSVAGASAPPQPDSGSEATPTSLAFQSTRYRHATALGAGSMGEVLRVHDGILERSVAVKVLRHKVAGRKPSTERFLQEAQITAQLQHHGIVPVYEMGHLEDGRPFFTMREVRGRTLSDAIRSVHAASEGPRWQQDPEGCSLRRLLEAFLSACEAVAYAHARGVVHRDLKPSNIMLGQYGEVLVLDWGVAKLLSDSATFGRDAVAVTTARTTHEVGVVAGTLAYMAPEQALGESVNASSDVFSLGAVLFEILCNRTPFAERESSTISTVQVVGTQPAASAPQFLVDRPIAEDLQVICLRALAQAPSSRYPNAGALALDMAAWLEGAKSRARAEAVLSEASDSSAELERLRMEADGLHAQASAWLENIPSFLPVEAKAGAWALQDRSVELEREAAIQSVKVGQTLRAALTHDGDLPEAHALLADHYLKEHQHAEQSGNHQAAERLAIVIRDHDRGRHARYLKGDGALTLVTEPAGADVDLFAYEVRNRRLQLGPRRSLGRAPVRAVELPMGSYLVILRAEGCQDVRYPVFIERQQHWDCIPPDQSEPEPIRLPRVGELDPDERYVPAGWFWSGGDGRALGRRSVMQRRRVWLDGFAIRMHHVTIGEYVAFLNALCKEGRHEAASSAAPRTAGRQGELGQLLLERRTDGTFFVPPNNYFGIPWQEGWPVIFVDWFSAVAYAKWKASAQGRPYRLPMELEWEKAARGVDGRNYPWGDFLDPTWCRMLETHAGLPTMAEAGSYLIDESPYGVRDLAGNQRDWCLDVPREQGPPLTAAGGLLGYHDSHEAWNVRVARGGNFLDSPLWCSTYHRSSFLPHLRDYIVSFRTARSMDGAFPLALSLVPT